MIDFQNLRRIFDPLDGVCTCGKNHHNCSEVVPENLFPRDFMLGYDKLLVVKQSKIGTVTKKITCLHCVHIINLSVESENDDCDFHFSCSCTPNNFLSLLDMYQQ